VRHPFAILFRPRGRLAAFFLAAAIVDASSAQDVEVTTVRYGNVRVPASLSSTGGAVGNWFEADVQLNVRPPPGSRGQMVSSVRVSVLLGFELPAPVGGERRIEHFRAEAECVALETGRVNVRFYLPPEIVKRDQLHGDPKYWGVEITAGGRALAASKSAYAATLPGAEQRKNFQARGGAAAAANDGILLPQFLTPFANENPRSTPSFVRRDAR